MSGLDYAVVAAYLIAALGWGARHARRAGRDTNEFFVAGRALPWWLAGTSIVATTFAADTPLAIAGLVATEGISGNWFWWADVLPTAIGALWIAALWQRSGVLTDNELTELRYAGRPAAGLRLFRALYFGVLRNAIVIGWVNLAMAKVLQLALGLDPEQGGWLLAGLFALTVLYTGLSGLWGVVVTDALQFVLALGCALGLALIAVEGAGGMSALLAALHDRPHTLALVPSGGEAFWAFVVYLCVQSWASGNSEGNGYVAQRLLATRSARDARLAALWYAVAHFALRPWPWILVGLVAVVRFPALEDPEAGYVMVMLDELPAGARGLMLASLLAAFMSTIDTQLNWGASYLTHDVYRRFARPAASERELVAVARASVVVLAALGAVTTLSMDSISGAWKLLATLSAGTGLIWLLRWLWWRINAWSEVAVMSASLLGANAVALWGGLAFPFSLALVVAFSVPFALCVTLLTPPESDATLDSFYRRVRPPGAWRRVAERCALAPRALGLRAVADVLAATLGVYGVLLGVGQALLGRPLAGSGVALAGLAALAWVVRSAGRRAAADSES